MKRRMSTALCPKSIRPAALSLAAVVCLMGCAPKAVRGGEGTSNPNLDNAAMSTGLDRVDVKDLVAKNLEAMMSSGWWSKDVQAAESAPVVAIWPIKNSTSEHIEDQMLMLLSEMETTLALQTTPRDYYPDTQALQEEEERYEDMQKSTGAFDLIFPFNEVVFSMRENSC